MTKNLTNRRYMSLKMTAEYIGLSPRTLYNQCAPGAKRLFPVKPKRVGKRLIFDRLELDKYMADK